MSPDTQRLHDHTPDQWSLEDSIANPDYGSGNYAKWSYNPRPQVTVEVSRVETSGTYAYTAKKSTSLFEQTYTAPEQGFAAYVRLAERLMQGINGISATDINQRLGRRGAGTALAPRVATWKHLASLYEAADQDLTYIDGVGDAVNRAVGVAVHRDVLEQPAVDAVRSPAEAADNDAVYVVLPTVDDGDRGWRIRKEWRSPKTDQLQGSILLPSYEPMGETCECVSKVFPNPSGQSFARVTTQRRYGPQTLAVKSGR